MQYMHYAKHSQAIRKLLCSWISLFSFPLDFRLFSLICAPFFLS